MSMLCRADNQGIALALSHVDERLTDVISGGESVNDAVLETHHDNYSTYWETITHDEFSLIILSLGAAAVQLEQHPDSPFAAGWAEALGWLNISDADPEPLVNKLRRFAETYNEWAGRDE